MPVVLACPRGAARATILLFEQNNLQPSLWKSGVFTASSNLEAKIEPTNPSTTCGVRIIIVWQTEKDSNPHHMVLETSIMPLYHQPAVYYLFRLIFSQLRKPICKPIRLPSIVIKVPSISGGGTGKGCPAMVVYKKVPKGSTIH